MFEDLLLEYQLSWLRRRLIRERRNLLKRHMEDVPSGVTTMEVARQVAVSEELIKFIEHYMDSDNLKLRFAPFKPLHMADCYTVLHEHAGPGVSRPVLDYLRHQSAALAARHPWRYGI